MARFDLTLPASLPSAPREEQEAFLIQAQARLASLKTQFLASEIAAVFEAHPSLQAALFHANEDEYGDLCVDFCSNRSTWSQSGPHCARSPIALDPDAERPGVMDPAVDGLSALLCRDFGEDAWWAFHRAELRRPASGAIAAAFLAQALAPEEFALWQASQIDDQARPPSLAPRKPLSL